MTKRFYHGAAIVGIIGLCLIGVLLVVDNPTLTIGASAEATSVFMVQDSVFPSFWDANQILNPAINLGTYDSGNDLWLYMDFNTYSGGSPTYTVEYLVSSVWTSMGIITVSGSGGYITYSGDWSAWEEIRITCNITDVSGYIPYRPSSMGE